MHTGDLTKLLMELKSYLHLQTQMMESWTIHNYSLILTVCVGGCFASTGPVSTNSLSRPHSRRGVQRPGASPDSRKISWKNINTILRHTRARCVRRHAPKATDTDTHCVRCFSLWRHNALTLGGESSGGRAAGVGWRCCVSEASSCCLPRNVETGYTGHKIHLILLMLRSASPGRVWGRRWAANAARECGFQCHLDKYTVKR